MAWLLPDMTGHNVFTVKTTCYPKEEGPSVVNLKLRHTSSNLNVNPPSEKPASALSPGRGLMQEWKAVIFLTRFCDLNFCL